MADIAVQVEVRLWGQRVGALVELSTGPVIFEYADRFRASGLEISPLHLPLALRGPIRFDELRRSPAFGGLPGVLADSLPDAFGNRVIRAWLAARGEESELSAAQRLLYVGERAMGALTYHPASTIGERAAEVEALEIAELVLNARRIVEGSPDVAIPEIYRIGSSAGGMRPKAVVLHDPATGEIRSAFAEPGAGDLPAILKFDGVGDGATADDLGRPLPFNRIEAAYTEIAREAGIDTVDCELVHDGSHAHLMVRRFDVTADGDRIHQHSFGGLTHIDYNAPGASSYEEYLRVILRLGMPHADLEEGFRRAVFNVLAVNQDDHVKNLSFHMFPTGEWRLTPAYDLTFAHGRGWTSRHQMQVQGRTEGITATHLEALAESVSVRRPTRILERVRDALAAWPEQAKRTGVPPDDIQRIGNELAARRKSVFG